MHSESREPKEEKVDRSCKAAETILSCWEGAKRRGVFMYQGNPLFPLGNEVLARKKERKGPRSVKGRDGLGVFSTPQPTPSVAVPRPLRVCTETVELGTAHSASRSGSFRVAATDKPDQTRRCLGLRLSRPAPAGLGDSTSDCKDIRRQICAAASEALALARRGALETASTFRFSSTAP